MLTKSYPVRGQVDTEKRVTDVSDNESSQIPRSTTECGERRSKSSWDEVENKDSCDMTSTQDDATGIATLEIYKEKNS